jgi:hypothetical protein
VTGYRFWKDTHTRPWIRALIAVRKQWVADRDGTTNFWLILSIQPEFEKPSGIQT